MKLIVVIGPTGIGKTTLSLEIANIFGKSIISADSRQVYKEMSIGTAKPTPDERVKAKFHLIDFLSIKENYSAGKFVEDATVIIEEEKHNPPIISGGTGFYISALFNGIDTFPDVNSDIIHELRTSLENGQLSLLQEELKKTDPAYFSTIDIHNGNRIIRALGVIRQTGTPFSHYLNKGYFDFEYEPIYVVLDLPRDIVYQRINKRVQKMIDTGLIEEVKSLISYRNLDSLNTVGYKEVFKYLDGEWTKDKMIEEIQKNTRRYAKRQITWNKNQLVGSYFSPGQNEQVIEHIKQKLK